MGNVMYILLLRHCFFPSMLRETLGRSAPAQCRVVFDQLKKIAKFFFVFPLLKTPTSQQNFSFFLVCRVPRPVPPHSLAHHKRRRHGGGVGLALLLNFSWENSAAFSRILASRTILSRFYCTPTAARSRTIFLNSGRTPVHTCNRRPVCGVVGSSARVTQSDVCDVTFPKNGLCARCSPLLSRALTFFRGPSFALSVPHWRRRRRRGHFGTSCRICRVVSSLLFPLRLPISQ